VDEHIRVLLQALAPGKTTNDTCAHMLRAMVPGSLGPAKSMRDDLQNRGSEIIESELCQMEKDYTSITQSYEEVIGKMTAQLTILKKVCKSDALPLLEEEERKLLANLKDIRSSIDSATHNQHSSEQDLFKIQRQLDDAKRNHGSFLDIFNNHYVPLKDDDALGSVNRKNHITALKSVEGAWILSADQDIMRVQQQLDDAKHKLTAYMDVFNKSYIPLRDDQTLNAASRRAYLMNLRSLEGAQWISAKEQEAAKAEHQLDDAQRKHQEFVNVFDRHFVPLRDAQAVNPSSRRGHIMSLCSVQGLDWLSGSEQEAATTYQQLEDAKHKLSGFMSIFDSHYMPLRDDQTLNDSSRHGHFMQLRSLEGMGWIVSAEQQVSTLQQQLDTAQGELSAFSDAFQNCFLRLEEDETLNAASRRTYIQKLMPFLRTCDECVVASFEPAATHAPSERGPWCKEVLKELRRFFTEKQQELENEVRKLQSQLRDAKRCLLEELEKFMTQQLQDLKRRVEDLEHKHAELLRKQKERLEEFMTSRLDALKQQVREMERALEDVLRQLMEALHEFMALGLEKHKSRVHELEVPLEDLIKKLRADLEKFMTERLRALESQIKDLDTAYEKACEALQTIKERIMKLRAKEKELLGKLNDVRKQKEMHARVMRAYQQKVIVINQRIETVRMETATVTQALERFRSGALQALHCLKDHAVQEFSTKVDEYSVFKYDAHVRDKIKILGHPLKNLHGPSLDCREMLFCSAPECLCPSAGERRYSQRSQCVVVGEALQGEETALKEAVEAQLVLISEKGGWQISQSMLLALLNVGTKEDEARKPKDDGLSLASQLVSEKEKGKLQAAQKYDETLKSLTQMENGLKEARKEYEHAQSLLNAARNMVSTRWTPLKESATMNDFEAEQHLNPLMGFFKRDWGFEECLLGSLRPAAKHRPGQRGHWCQETIAEAERKIQAKFTELEALVQAKSQAIAEWESKVTAAQRDAESAKEAKEIAKILYDLVQTLADYVKELSNHRLEVLSAFHWLQERGLTQDQPAVTASLLPITIKQFSQVVETTVIEVQELQQQWEDLKF